MRRGSYVFVEDENQPRKANCRICEETEGKINRLVPRYVNGILDDKFKICGYCGEIYPMYDIMSLTEYEPKASLVNYDNPFATGVDVKAISTKRRTRESNNALRPYDNEFEIPKLAGKEDELLKNKLNEGAIIISITDRGNEEE